MLRVLKITIVAALLSTNASAKFFSIQDSLRSVNSAKAIAIEDLELRLQPGWVMKQSAQDLGVKILNFSKGHESIQMYVREAAHFDMRAVFVNDSTIVNEMTDAVGALSWNILSTHKAAQEETEEVFVTAFAKEFNGNVYYGYSSSAKLAASEKTVAEFLKQISVPMTDSLTSPEYDGKKYYLGFGRAMSGDPSMMHNEVKYDVLHTHDIFTKEVGGTYIGTKYTTISEATSANVRKSWSQIKEAMTAKDMYVQYSSGHGSSSGLEVGVSYNEIRDNALSYPAQELVVFIMACHSGALVDSFNAKKSEWSNFQSIGRTLYVMASSKASELSSTGPGTDPDEPGGPNGSSGSAFGWALWKSLIGYADGYVDGVKDGYISLEEITKHTIAKTKAEGGHTPVYTGAYDAKLKMNRVPPKEFLDSLEHSSEGLSPEELHRQIQELDAAMRIASN